MFRFKKETEEERVAKLKKAQMKDQQDKDALILEIAKGRYNEKLRELILEENRVPGTYKTKIKVDRIGEGAYLNIGKSTKEATKFINNVIHHRCQIIHISASAEISVSSEASFLEQYIVTYWYIQNEKEIYDEILKTVREEAAKL